MMHMFSLSSSSSSLLWWLLLFLLLMHLSESIVISRRGSIIEGFTLVTSSIVSTSNSDVNDGPSFLLSANPTATYESTIIPSENDKEQDEIMSDGTSLTVPLKWIPDLQAYVLYYTVGGDPFGAIVDTGSPFLTVPSYCDETKWGCYRAESSIPSGLPPSIEQFDNNEGEVEWRTAPFAFVTNLYNYQNKNNDKYYGKTNYYENNDILPKAVTFGVLSESLMDGPGGVFFGLVKRTDARIRPSFLSQLNKNICSFQIDLSSPQKSLMLSTKPLLSSLGKPYIPLVKDLHRRYGDPTFHYTARASSITVNGNPLFDPYAKNKPIYVIFDTGVTGMALSKDLFDLRYIFARRNKEKNLWGNVQITFPTKQNQTRTAKSKIFKNGTTSTTTLSAIKPITTPIGEIPWPRFDNQAHLIVIGLSFFDGNKLTFDIDDGKFWLETPESSESPPISITV